MFVMSKRIDAMAIVEFTSFLKMVITLQMFMYVWKI